MAQVLEKQNQGIQQQGTQEHQTQHVLQQQITTMSIRSSLNTNNLELQHLNYTITTEKCLTLVTLYLKTQTHSGVHPILHTTKVEAVEAADTTVTEDATATKATETIEIQGVSILSILIIDPTQTMTITRTVLIR